MNVKARLERLEQEVQPKGDRIISVCYEGEAPEINGILTTYEHLEELEAEGHEILLIQVCYEEAIP